MLGPGVEGIGNQIRGVTTKTSLSEIQAFDLELASYGGYDVLAKKKIKMGTYRSENDGRFVTDGDPFIIINVETNSALQMSGKLEYPSNKESRFSQASTVPKATVFYMHTEKDGNNTYTCFSHRENKPIFDYDHRKPKDRKIFVAGFKGQVLKSDKHKNLKRYIGFMLFNRQNEQVTKPKYCTPYRISQANNWEKKHERIFINVQGNGFLNPNSSRENGPNNTFIFFPDITKEINTCMSFRLKDMKNLRQTHYLWKGREPEALINYCGESKRLAYLCQRQEKEGNFTTYNSLLSDYCSNFYLEVLKTKPDSSEIITASRETFDGIVRKTCKNLYDKDFRNITLCQCQYPVYKYHEARDKDIVLPQQPICYSEKCQKIRERTYLTEDQEREGCKTRECIVEDIDSKSIKVIQLCNGRKKVVGSTPWWDEDEDDDGNDDDNDENNGDDDKDENDDRKSGDKDKETDDKVGDPQDTEEKDSPPTDRTFLYLALGGAFILIFALVIFLLVRRRKNK